MARLLRRLHRLHRALGSVLCVLMATWFVSGAVMTFARYPRYGARARLADLPPLGALSQEALPAALLERLDAFMKEPGAELAITRPLGAPRLLLKRAGATETVLSLTSGEPLGALSEVEARLLAQRVVAAPVHTLTRLDESDQWSVALPAGVFPLFRLALSDRAESELYVSLASAEIVQRSTRTQRVLAWLGAIPHWIYPTLLRRERTLWRNLVIVLAAFGLLLTGAGLIAGVDSARRLKRRRFAHGPALNDAYLRLHQRIGLGFGALVLGWLFSGILSFNPLDWTNTRGLYGRTEQRLRGAAPPFASAALARLPEALSACQRVLDVRELRVRYLASSPLAVCLGAGAERGLVALSSGSLQVERVLSPAQVAAAARALAGANVPFSAQRVDRADQYYYPTHTEPDLVLPYIRVAAEDNAQTTYYLDPHSGELLNVLNARSRLERFLYHGLHSWDFDFLYAQRGLWRTLVLLAMGFGASLSLLGVALTVRRALRRRQKLRRLRARAQSARSGLDASGQSVG